MNSNDTVAECLEVRENSAPLLMWVKSQRQSYLTPLINQILVIECKAQ